MHLKDHYATLHVSTTATQDEIKSAYKILAQKHHPDKGGDVEVMIKLNEAYQTLSDPVKRKAYDDSRNHGQHTSSNQSRSTYKNRPNPENDFDRRKYKKSEFAVHIVYFFYPRFLFLYILFLLARYLTEGIIHEIHKIW